MKQETKTTDQEAVAEIMETESERDKRLKKERIAWQQAHPNKWS